GKVAGEVSDRRLQFAVLAPPCDRVVHPGAAALRIARIEVHVELPDERSRAVANLVEAHVLVPRRRLRRTDGDAVKRLGDAKESLYHHLLGEILLHLLVGERVTL